MFFLVRKVKTVILKMRSGGFSQKLTAILQHATAEKRAGDGMFFFLLLFFCVFFLCFFFKSSYLSFGLKFRYILMAQVLPGMQNKLSKSRDLALEPMG